VAGLFEAPPRVLKAVEDWAMSVYAGHVLALVEKQIDTKPDDTEKRLAQTQKYLQGLLTEKMDKMDPGDLLRIPAGRNTDVVLKMPLDTEWHGYQDHFQVVTVKKGQRPKFPRSPDDGASKYDPEVVGYYKAEDNWENDRDDFLVSLEEPAMAGNKVEAILRRGLETYSKEVRQNVRQNMNPTRLVELELMRREAKKFTSKSKSYKSKARTTLPIDLSGWKYLDGMSASEVEQKQVEGKFTTFTCTLNFKPHKRRGGQWDSRNLEMQLDLRSGMDRPKTLKDFRKGLQRIRDISRHETIHLGQTALIRVKDLAGWSAGYPSRDLQEEDGSEYIRGKRLPHPRRSVEFYTRLADEVSKFAVEIKSIPLPKRRGFLRRWFDTREFFKANKRHNPDKWQKMVGEFISEIDKQGIYIPSATNVSETADVADTATIGPDAIIQGSPKIEGQAKALGSATIKDSARLSMNAVVKDDAVVGGSAEVTDSAVISGNAQVTGGLIGSNATVSDNAVISGDPKVYGTVYHKGEVSGRAEVGAGATVSGGEVTDRAVLGGRATLYAGLIQGNAQVLDRASVSRNGVVSDNAVVKDSARIEGASVGGDAVISGRAVVSGDAVVIGNTRIEGNARVSGGVWDGQHVTSGYWKEPPQIRAHVVRWGRQGVQRPFEVEQVENHRTLHP
jgi:carbonic anhydrase/acetyltransferase-like protein (isoleucine patch superfamily)